MRLQLGKELVAGRTVVQQFELVPQTGGIRPQHRILLVQLHVLLGSQAVAVHQVRIFGLQMCDLGPELVQMLLLAEPRPASGFSVGYHALLPPLVDDRLVVVRSEVALAIGVVDVVIDVVVVVLLPRACVVLSLVSVPRNLPARVP